MVIRRMINQSILSLFSKKNNQKWKEDGWPNSPLALYLDIDFEIIDVHNVITSYWWKRYQNKEITSEELDFAILSYNNVIEEVNFTLLARKQNGIRVIMS